jgi:hypothetical protein
MIILLLMKAFLNVVMEKLFLTEAELESLKVE